MPSQASITVDYVAVGADVARLNAAVFLIAEGKQQDAEKLRQLARRKVPSGIGMIRHLPASAGLGPCGGDLPSCAIVARESGGDYSAYNPGGCGGSGCFGKFQFSGEWAGKLGLPVDLSTATPAQQDEAARQLWRNGAGCSNWSCG